MNGERTLEPDDLDRDPITQFAQWFDEATAAGVPEPEAMCGATSVDGIPSARMVLLKSAATAGFGFYTHYDSQKGREVVANPVASLVWRWHAVGRQVRATGTVERVSAKESDAYFTTRDR